MEIEEEVKQFQIAPISTRVINYVIDQMVFLLIILAHEPLGFKINLSNLQNETPSTLIYLMLLNTLYYFIMEVFLSKTIGKMITRTSVVNEEGEKPSISHLAIRSLCRNLPFDNISFLVFAKGWHDQISKTTVVFDSYKIIK